MRVVDGGYFENSGLTTMIDFRHVIEKDEDIKKVSLKVIVIENSEATTDWSYARG